MTQMPLYPQVRVSPVYVAPVPKPVGLQQRFDEFHERNPHIYTEITRRARALQRRGFKHFGLKAIWEAMRYEASVRGDTGEDWKLDNRFTSRYARLIDEREPDLRGFFEMRATRS